MEDKIELVKKIAFFALIFALLSISIAENIVPTTTGVQWVVNNTNLAPHVIGGPDGTGERIADNTTYHNNNYPIEIFLYEHKNTVGLAPETYLYINDTLVTHANKSIVAIIPQYSKYSVDMTNPLWYTWYEYPMLTGNVTTIGSGTCTSGCINQTQLDTKVNKSGDRMTGILNINDIRNTSYVSIIGGLSELDLNAGIGLVYNSASIYLFDPVTVTSNFYTDVDMNHHYITNCNNCWNETVNNSKVNKSGDTMFGNLYNNNSNIQAKHLEGESSNESLPEFIDNDECFTGACSVYLGQFSAQNRSASVTFSTRSNSTGNFNVFSAIRTNGTLNNYNALAANQNIFFIGARGSSSSTSDGSTSGSKATIIMRTGGSTWNTTSNPTAIDFATTPNTSITRTTAVTIESSGNMTFRKSDSGITLKSPDSNDWCVRVSNAGALTVTAGKCVQ